MSDSKCTKTESLCTTLSIFENQDFSPTGVVSFTIAPNGVHPLPITVDVSNGPVKLDAVFALVAQNVQYNLLYEITRVTQSKKNISVTNGPQPLILLPAVDHFTAEVNLNLTLVDPDPPKNKNVLYILTVINQSTDGSGNPIAMPFDYYSFNIVCHSPLTNTTSRHWRGNVFGTRNLPVTSELALTIPPNGSFDALLKVETPTWSKTKLDFTINGRDPGVTPTIGNTQFQVFRISKNDCDSKESTTSSDKKKDLTNGPQILSRFLVPVQFAGESNLGFTLVDSKVPPGEYEYLVRVFNRSVDASGNGVPTQIDFWILDAIVAPTTTYMDPQCEEKKSSRTIDCFSSLCSLFFPWAKCISIPRIYFNQSLPSNGSLATSLIPLVPLSLLIPDVSVGERPSCSAGTVKIDFDVTVAANLLIYTLFFQVFRINKKGTSTDVSNGPQVLSSLSVPTDSTNVFNVTLADLHVPHGIYTYNIVFSVAISGGTGTLPIRNYAVNIAAVAIEEEIINSLCC
jgi:hypothetical protein